MPETPNNHDDPDDDRFDRLLRDAGARMRAATESVHPPAIRPTGARGAQRRWIVPVAIVAATAAAAVAAVWIAGPATETVREAPADTGVVSTPGSAVDSLPVVAPIESTPPSDTAPVETTPADSAPAPAPDVVSLGVTDPDFDGAGGTCLQFRASSDTADGCFTHDQLSSNPTWVVAFTDQAFEITVDAVDTTQHSWTAIDAVCDYAPSSLIPARWLQTSCSTGEYFWFEAAPRTPDGETATYVVPPQTGELVHLEPIASALPDGYTAYRASYEQIVGYRCLVVASFPDPWREACVVGGDLPRVFVPVGGSVFVVEVAPDFGSAQVQDIAVLSVPIAGCTAPVSDMVAPLDSRVMISRLVCAGDWAMVGAPSALLGSGPVDGSSFLLERADDSSWSTAGGGTSFPCDFEPHPACEVFGVDDDLVSAPLPIPPWGSIGAREHDLDPIEITAEVRGFTDGDRTAVEIMGSVATQYSNADDNQGNYEVVDSLDSLGLVIVDVPQADDSIGVERFAVWYRPSDDGTLTVERAYRIASCSRGVAAPDMCV